MQGLCDIETSAYQLLCIFALIVRVFKISLVSVLYNIVLKPLHLFQRHWVRLVPTIVY